MQFFVKLKIKDSISSLPNCCYLHEDNAVTDSDKGTTDVDIYAGIPIYLLCSVTKLWSLPLLHGEWKYSAKY